MFYKNWPYWLKGGLLSAVIINIVIVIIYWFIRFILPSSYINDILVLITTLFYIPAIILALPINLDGCFFMDAYCPIFSNSDRFFMAIILSLVGWFIIGAVIGLIYGKIKVKK